MKQDQYTWLVSKVENIDTKLDSVDKHLAVYNEQLKVHIKRSELLEKEMKPVKNHVEFVNFVAKLISLLSFAAGIVITILTLLEQ